MNRRAFWISGVVACLALASCAVRPTFGEPAEGTSRSRHTVQYRVVCTGCQVTYTVSEGTARTRVRRDWGESVRMWADAMGRRVQLSVQPNLGESVAAATIHIDGELAAEARWRGPNGDGVGRVSRGLYRELGKVCTGLAGSRAGVLRVFRVGRTMSRSRSYGEEERRPINHVTPLRPTGYRRHGPISVVGTPRRSYGYASSIRLASCAPGTSLCTRYLGYSPLAWCQRGHDGAL